MAQEKEGAPPEEATRAWPVVFAVYTGATLGFALLVGATNALGLDICRSAMTYPTWMFFSMRDTAVESCKIGLLHGGVVMLPLIGFMRTEKTWWGCLECVLLAAGPIAFVYLPLFFDMPVPH